MPGRGQQSSVPANLRLRLLVAGVLLMALIGLTLAWSWSPLRQWLDVDRIVAVLEHVGQSYGPAVATLAFTVAVTLAVPLTFLTIVTLVTFGPEIGFFISMVGAAVGAVATFGLGKVVGHEIVRRLGGPKVNRISEKLAGRGILAVIAIRLLPIAPFAIVNMVAGATHLRLRDMLLGTIIGMLPGTLIMAFFVDQLIDALKRPNLLTVVFAVTAVVLIGTGIWGFRKWLQKPGQ